MRGEKTVVDWSKLDFESFARLADDESLSKYEKIGFPDSYREGYEDAIFSDIRDKLPRLTERNLRVLDIGPGCSDLPHMIIELCRGQGHRLVLVDSDSMLKRLPDEDFIEKRPGLFPKNRSELNHLAAGVDVIICYSVLHYVFVDANPFDFLDLAIELLAPGGQFLIGDVPNLSKRQRFFSSAAGVAFHQAFTGSSTMPTLQFNTPATGAIDDSVLLALISRARSAGVDAYLLPQPMTLPMHNRREDILIRRP